jgi:hypothetical protein
MSEADLRKGLGTCIVRFYRRVEELKQSYEQKDWANVAGFLNWLNEYLEAYESRFFFRHKIVAREKPGTVERKKIKRWRQPTLEELYTYIMRIQHIVKVLQQQNEQDEPLDFHPFDEWVKFHTPKCFFRWDVVGWRWNRPGIN